MSQTVDYSFSRPNPADLAAQGFIGALRYLAPLPNTKVITGDELASLHANGLAVGFVWESGASRASKGEAAGHADARAANDQADTLGTPDATAIYFAVDYDANPDVVAAYFIGVRAVSKRPVGVYGSYAIVEAQLDAGCRYGWQTAAWSHDQHSARAHLYQRADAAANPPAGCNVDEVLQDDWGQWAPGASLDPARHPVQEDIVRAIIIHPADKDGNPLNVPERYLSTNELESMRWITSEEEMADLVAFYEASTITVVKDLAVRHLPPLVGPSPH